MYANRILKNNGVEVKRNKITTAGAPNKIEMIPDRETINADGEDLSFITVRIEYENSNFCPLADHKVEFKVTGPATIAAVGNGNAASTEPFQANFRKAFRDFAYWSLKVRKENLEKSLSKYLQMD